MPGYSSSVRGVFLQLPEALLEERRKLGHDRHDEVWDGELHMPPVPSSNHGRRAIDLGFALRPITEARGLLIWPDQTGVFGPAGSMSNYRVPDLSVARPDQVSKRGLETAELVVELLSEHDESRKKFPFYAVAGVREIWLLDPETRRVEIYELVGSGYNRVVGDRSPALGIELRVAGGKLELRDGDYVAAV
jgi:Uma2 family endonuclease